jgi:hypothetical protein
MIAIQSQDGELVKVLKNVVDGEFGFHKSFGVISKTRAEERIITKKRQCFDFTSDEWHCSFKIESKTDDKQFKLLALAGCEAIFEKEMWILKTPMGTFNVSSVLDSTISPLLEDHEDKASWLDKVSYLSFLLIFLLIPIYYYLSHETKPVVDVDKVEEPITVQIIKPVKTVKIEQMINPTITTDTKVKNVTSKQAVQRNLGFLGMVGSKDLSKVVGGVPQNLKVATAGAGPGGDAGSGGEVLTGLGKGLRKTTVGNTGVQGLGGVGTKGAGGGLGGYGNTLVASGSGKGISALAVSNSEMVMEGGLSKYVINATIAKYLSQVRRCYESELKNSPELQGLVEMSFEINGNGRLNFANVSKTTLNSPPVESCISTKMMDWQFPNPKGGVNVPVKYPFMLRPVGN